MKVKVDRAIRDVSAEEFDAVHLPGGTVNADSMRMVPEVQAFLRENATDSDTMQLLNSNWLRIQQGLRAGRQCSVPLDRRQIPGLVLRQFP